MGSAKAAEALALEFYHLDFALHRSRRYHEKMASFYAGWRDRARVINVVAGSGVFVLVAGGAGSWGVLAAGLAALWSVLDLILTPDKKADLHQQLRQRFTELARETGSSERTETQLKILTSARLRLEEEEPPCKRLVDIEARNDELRARDHDPNEQAPLSKAQRILGRYFDFDMDRLELWKHEQQRRERDATTQ